VFFVFLFFVLLIFKCEALGAQRGRSPRAQTEQPCVEQSQVITTFMWFWKESARIACVSSSL